MDPRRSHSVSRSSILLVHPDRDPARDLANGLRASGFDVVTVPDGERAIDRFIQEPFGVLVTEMALPGRDGGTTAESIRWAPGGQEVTVILLATRGSGVDALKEAASRNRAAATYLGPVEAEPIAKLVLDAVDDPRPTLPESGRPVPSTDIDTAATDAIRGQGRARPSPPSPDPPFAYALVQQKAPVPNAARPFPGRPELTPDWRAGDDPLAEREGQAVEAHAASTERSSAVFAGDLRDTSFPELLYRVGAMRSTGALVLADDRDLRRTTTGEHCKKAVFFRLGVPVYVQSNLVEECLGHILARAGRITPEQLEESLLRMRRSDARQGTVLLEMNAIDPKGLREALQDQLRVKLFDLFAWSQGDFRFSTKMAPPAETVTLDMSLPETVLRGIVHRVAPTRLLGLMSPNLDRFVIPRFERLQAFTGLAMPPEAREILRKLDGTRKLRDLLSDAGARPGAAAQLVYALQCVDGIEFSGEPAAQASPAALDPAPTATGTSEELRQAALLLRDDDVEEAVGVPLSDPEVVPAIRQLRERFQPFTEPGSARRGLRALAYEVTARLARLERTLTRPSLSSDVPVASDLPRPPPPPPPADADAFDDEAETDSTPSPPPREPVSRGATLRLPSRDDTGVDGESDATHRGRDPGESRRDGRDSAQEVARFVDRAIDGAVLTPSSDEGAPLLGTRPTTRSERPEKGRELAEQTFDEGSDGDTSTLVENERLRGAEVERAPATAADPAALMPGSAPRTGTGHFEDETEMADDDDPLQPLSIPPPAPDDTDLDARVQRLYQAERVFRRGCRALARDRYDGAIDAFDQAVTLCPDEGEFVAHLAYARFMASRDPEDTARALAELERGRRLSPKLASVHVLLARASRAQGETQLARDAYTQALSADPECQEAIDGLRALGPS